LGLVKSGIRIKRGKFAIERSELSRPEFTLRKTEALTGLDELFPVSSCTIREPSLLLPMKVNRHDQAKILSADELAPLFSEGLTNSRDRALFGICLYTACRINEACSLHTADVFSARGEVRERITFRCESTKGK
jgi:integrase